MKSLIIIPTYNEADNIIPLFLEIKKHYQGDILIVDDGSPDGTAQKVKEFQQKNPHVVLLERPKKMGLASAYLTGFKQAIKKEYDVVFAMDADFSHNPKYLPLMLKAIKNGASLVIGSRYVKGGGVSNWGWFRRLISKGGNCYAKIVLCSSIKDITGGFKAFKIETLKKINLQKVTSEGYSFQIELNHIFSSLKFPIVEIPIVFEERREGKSKMSKKIFFEAIKQVWKLKFKKIKKEFLL